MTGDDGAGEAGKVTGGGRMEEGLGSHTEKSMLRGKGSGALLNLERC